MLLVALSRRMCCSRVGAVLAARRVPQREAQGGLALGVYGDADEATGHEALVVFPGGHEGRVRAAISHGHAKTLAAAHDHIRAKLSGRAQQRQRQQVGGDHDEGVVRVRLGAKIGVIEYVPVAGGVLDERAEGGLGEIVRLVVADDHLNVQGDGAGLHDGDGLWVAAVGNEEDVGGGFAWAGAQAEGHRFGGGGGFVQQGGIGDFQPR